MRFWIAVLLTCAGGFAQAKDLVILSRILIPAYTAQNIAAVCVIVDPSFLSRTADASGHVHFFAKHVRDEVLSELDDDLIDEVLRMSASTAQAIVRKELGSIEASTPREQSVKLGLWCEQSAELMVRQIIYSHMLNHAQVDRLLSEAKR